MRHLQRLFRRFARDERGAFAVIFAIMAVVLVALSGAVVDFTSMQQSRTKAQVALDAAALALQPSIYTDSSTTLQTEAQALVADRLADAASTWKDCGASLQDNPPPCVHVDQPQLDTENGQLTISADLVVPMNFVSLVGVNTMTARIESVATRKKLNLEVAMVLDNSGSMAQDSRMTNLKKAVTCATNILFNNDCSDSSTTATQQNTTIGIIPFDNEVNVGSAAYNSDGSIASWLDTTGGTGHVANDNMDNDDDHTTPFGGQVNLVTLFNNLSLDGTKKGQMGWGGCVVSRKGSYGTDDTEPDPSNPDTLFTPFFAVDEPDSGFSNSYISDTGGSCKTPTVVWTEQKTKCSTQATNSSTFNRSCSGKTTDTYKETLNGTTTTLTALPGWVGASSDSYSSSGSSNNYTNTRTSTYGLGTRELEERLCKYTPASAGSYIKLTLTPRQTSSTGPNGDCPTNSIQPLTGDKSVVNAAIAKLTPQGNTNIQAGIEWGFHVLSPTEPFTEGRPYDQATSKIIIMMTDGENNITTASSNINGASRYTYYQYPYNGLLGAWGWSASQILNEANARTVQTCANAKAKGIVIYTIGLATDQTSDPDGNKQMLEDCSSGDGYNYFPTDPTQLEDVFSQIANQLAALRLAK